MEIVIEYDGNSDACKWREIEFKISVYVLKKKVNFLSEKKNYYKAKVKIKFYWD